MQAQQIIALPTLVKCIPLPVRKIIGDLSNKQQLLRGLDLWPAE
jgi:circadian clock protein KaiB